MQTRIKSYEFRVNTLTLSAKSMSAFNSELLAKNLNLEETKKVAIRELEAKRVADVEEAIRRTKVEIFEERAANRKDEDTMTEVDARMEKILRQREFNQALVKYRAVNTAQESLIPVIPLKELEQTQKTFMPYDELYRPMAALINTVLKQKQKRDDLKSKNNVIKMLAGLYATKMNAMARKSSEPVALMNVDCFFFHHIQ